MLILMLCHYFPSSNYFPDYPVEVGVVAQMTEQGVVAVRTLNR
jgi:hypothetical protein